MLERRKRFKNSSMKKTRRRNSDRGALIVSQGHYQKELAQCIEPAFQLRPGRYTFRRAWWVAKPENTHPGNCKFRITMFLDADILNYFKARAARPHAAPYQTQINETPREVMEQETTYKNEHAAEYRRLLETPGFIEAVARRVKAKTAKRRKAG